MTMVLMDDPIMAGSKYLIDLDINSLVGVSGCSSVRAVNLLHNHNRIVNNQSN